MINRLFEPAAEIRTRDSQPTPPTQTIDAGKPRKKCINNLRIKSWCDLSKIFILEPHNCQMKVFSVGDDGK